ncbi:MAG: GGDEF domain-containing protein [Roseateles sp.]
MTPSPFQRLATLWLGTDATQRLRVRQTSLAMALMGLCVPLLHYAVGVAGDPRGPLLWLWTALSLGGVVLFYAAIRSGWSRRFADPSLTAAQITFAITSAALGYAQAGPLRGVVFPALTLILMFGMFQLRARSAYGLTAYALAWFGGVMTVMALRRPELYPPAVEVGHFLILSCMLPAVAMLTARLSRIRRRLAQQREELARALVQLQAIATRDELTGLPNRRQMQALMEQEQQRTLRHGHGFCIAQLDLDHFKRINDAHGHAAGDAVLRAFAQTGQAALRATDVLARWGGEEFLVLLPDTAMPPAVSGVERLREHTAAMRVDFGGATITVTVSGGLTAYRPGETLEQTLERADGLLYQAKNAGRNRICTG